MPHAGVPWGLSWMGRYVGGPWLLCFWMHPGALFYDTSWLEVEPLMAKDFSTEIVRL